MLRALVLAAALPWGSAYTYHQQPRHHRRRPIARPATALGSTREAGDAADAVRAAAAAAEPAWRRAVDGLSTEELQGLEGFQLARRLDGLELPRWRSADVRPAPTPLSTLSLVLKVYDDIPAVLGLNEEDAIGSYRTALFGAVLLGGFLANFSPLLDYLFPMPVSTLPDMLVAPGPPVEVDVAAVRAAARAADISFQLRYIWSAFFNLMPLGVIFAGLFARQTLDEALLRLRCSVDPAFRRRVTFHECGHLLTAYLVGLPVTGAALQTAVEVDIAGAMTADSLARGDRPEDNFAGAETSDEAWRRKVLQGTSGVEVSNEERGAAAVGAAAGAGAGANLRRLMNARFWPERLLNGVCVVSMGGIMAEVLDTGSARGGGADMRSLEGLLYSAIPEVPAAPQTEVEQAAFGPKENPANEERQDRVRWSAVEAFTLLKTNEPVLRALVRACGVDSEIDADSSWSFRSPLAPPVQFPPLADVVRIIETSEG